MKFLKSYFSRKFHEVVTIHLILQIRNQDVLGVKPCSTHRGGHPHPGRGTLGALVPKGQQESREGAPSGKLTEPSRTKLQDR